MFFRCKHPFEVLAVAREHQVTTIDDEFERVTYFFLCIRCGTSLQRTHARTGDRIETFLAREANP